MAKKSKTTPTKVVGIKNINEINLPAKMPAKYNLREDITKGYPSLYKANVDRRDTIARKIIEKAGIPDKSGNLIVGGMYLMQYFEPQNKDELEYYDAWPCSIIFGRFKNKEGEPRIIGFSIHHYPPKFRWNILNRIFEIFKPLYKEYWNKPLSKDFSHMDYKMLMEQLKKAKLDFGVRAYIPGLIGECIYIPTVLWATASYTEGRFKKKSRTAIMNYWKQWVESKKY